MENQLSLVINDFFDRKYSNDKHNYFHGDPLAEHFSRRISSPNQKKRFDRHGIVPMEFLNYLKNSDIGKPGIQWPSGRISVQVLSKLLDGAFKPAMIRRYPMLKKSFL